LAVGNDGEQIVADSSTSTGLRYGANFAAGKNKIINGDFGIWQRGTTFTNPNSVYLADRWTCSVAVAVPTWTITQQTFTPGTAPVAGYEGQYFMRAQVTAFGSSTAQSFRQKIEDVRTFAGQTITVSFWAKADTTRTINNPTFQQDFGSGGSGTVTTPVGGTSSLTTSWQRFSFTVAIPSVSGKTIGTSSSLILDINTPGASNYTMDIWGVQVEASNTATAFQTATGTIQGELAAAQRYYYRMTADSAYAYFGFGMATGTTNGKISIPTPVTMRVVPTSIDSPTASTLRFTDGVSGTTANATPTLDLDCTNEMLTFNCGVASGLTQYRSYWFGANNSSPAYVGFSAEL
jgi:hypothetical protein